MTNEFDNEGMILLRQAIISRAMDDYIICLLHERKHKKLSLNDLRIKGECEVFFKSQWFRGLLGYPMSFEKVREVAEKRVDYRVWKLSCGCAKCRKTGCVHKKDGESWDEAKKTDRVCPKKSQIKGRKQRKIT